MRHLSREAFDRARTFLKTSARPLDRALFEFRFEGGSGENVRRKLATYQNDDGGLGRGLEPDVRTPSSSALATSVGLQVLQEVGCPADYPLVRRAIQYLLSTFDPQAQVWRVVPQDTNSFPHAPWWHDEGGSLARTFDGFRIIPRAEIVSALHHFSLLVPGGWLDQITERTVADIEAIEVLGSGGGDDLRYALCLAETSGLPESYRGRLAVRIRSAAPAVVSRDPGQWGSYCIAPLKVVSSPQSILADLLWDEVQLHLDYQVDHQTAEGTWEPTWSWGSFYPDVWAQAKTEWRGHLTLDTLTVLRAFGRIEL